MLLHDNYHELYIRITVCIKAVILLNISVDKNYNEVFKSIFMVTTHFYTKKFLFSILQ